MYLERDEPEHSGWPSAQRHYRQLWLRPCRQPHVAHLWRGNLTGTSSGNGAHATTASYTYDAADRLTGASLSSGFAATYGYDADGRRVKQTVGTSVTKYLWDETSAYGDVVTETDGTGAIQASYVLGGGELLAQVRGSGASGVASYILPDGQGSVRGLANAAGAITDTYRYNAYGIQTSSTGTTSNPYRYDGQRLDDTTGLYQLRARSYDPGTGRFLCRDTAAIGLSDPAQLDRYMYAQDDPVDRTDPSGLFAIETAEQDETAVIATEEVVKPATTGATLGQRLARILVQALLLAIPAALVALPLLPDSGIGTGTGTGPDAHPAPQPTGATDQATATPDDTSETFYRGTTYYDALRVEAEGFDAAILRQRQSGREMDAGLFTSRNVGVAKYFANHNAHDFAGQGGAALITIILKRRDFQQIAVTYGVIDNRPIIGLPDGVPQPHVETLFPYAALPELNAKASITVEPLPLQ